MFRAIIADDENKVCKLIQKLGEWEKLSIEIVDVCNNGESALKSIEFYKPDIVITDIRMPGYDGFDLIRCVKDKGINSAFILISGYRQFEYAHSAMKFGVMDYLLKPIDKEELNNTLGKICKSIIEKKLLEKNRESMEKILTDNSKKQRENFLLNLYSKDLTLKNLNLEKINLQYNLSFQPGNFEVFIINTDNSSLHSEDTLFGEKSIEIAKKIFSVCFDVAIGFFDFGGICILNYCNEEKKRIKNLIREFFSRIKLLTEIYGEFSLAIGSGIEVDDISKLSTSLKTAIDSENGKIIFGWDKILDLSNSLFKEIDIEKIFSFNSKMKLKASMEALNVDEVSEWFREFERSLILIRDVNPTIIYKVRDKLLEIIVSFAEKNGFEEEYKPIIKIIKTKSFRAKNINNLVNIINEEFNLLINKVINHKENQSNKPIRLAKQYVMENYGEPITLDEVALYVNLSPAYFSAVFKKQEGNNFSDFVAEVRINAAKELLRTTGYNITKISSMVGYLDDKYFSKLFKKVVGLKPSEFRRLYS